MERVFVSLLKKLIVFIEIFYLIIEKDVQIFYEDRSIFLSTVFIELFNVSIKSISNFHEKYRWFDRANYKESKFLKKSI